MAASDALRMERAKLQLELEDAKAELQGLRRRTRQLVEDAQSVLDKVLENAALDPSEFDFSQESEANNRIGPEYRSVFDFNAVIGMVSQLRLPGRKSLTCKSRKGNETWQ